MGISGITYSKKYDRILVTASTENMTTAYDDGSIGKNYLFVFENFNKNLNGKTFMIEENKIVDLAKADEKFNGYKIESVCIESENDVGAILNLVADNTQA